MAGYHAPITRPLNDQAITSLVAAAKRAYIRKGDAHGTVGCNLQLSAFKAKREINTEQSKRARAERENAALG